MPSTPELQHTVAKTAGFSGTALHTGEKVTLKLHPAPADHGIKFRRKDLQDEPTIDAKIENLKTVERATTIGEGPIRVHTVEHRSEERRVGKECRSRWWPEHQKKKRRKVKTERTR